MSNKTVRDPTTAKDNNSPLSREQKLEWAVSTFKRYYPELKDVDSVNWRAGIVGHLYREKLESLLKSDTVLVDAACGKWSTFHKDTYQIKHSVGMDLSSDSLSQNNHFDKNVIGDLEDIPFEDESFDLIISRWAFEHLENPGKVLGEFSRVLKKDGRVLLLTPNIKSPASLVSKITPLSFHRYYRKKLFNTDKIDAHRTYYRLNSKNRLDKGFNKVGIVDEDFIYVGNPFFFYFWKPLFRIAIAFEKTTDAKSLRFLKSYIVATYRKK